MITTVTTVTTVAAMGLTSAMSIAAIVVLILLLITKEVTGASQSHICQLVTKLLNVSIVPLVMAFAIVLAVRIFEIII